MCVCWHGILFKEPNANGSRASDLIGLCRQHTKPNPQHTSDNKERQGRQGNPNERSSGEGGRANRGSTAARPTLTRDWGGPQIRDPVPIDGTGISFEIYSRGKPSTCTKGHPFTVWGGICSPGGVGNAHGRGLSRRGRRWEGGHALCDTARAGVRRVGARSRPGQGPSVVRKPRRGPAWPKLARQATVATPAWPCCARTGKAGAARRGRWATRTLGRRGRAQSGRRAAALSTVGWDPKRTRVIRLQCIRV